MKTLKAASVALLLSAGSGAADELPDVSTTDGLCGMVAMLAETSMRARQEGVALGTILETVETLPIGREIVLMAYERPRYNTPSVQRAEIADFRDQWHVECLRSAG